MARRNRSEEPTLKRVESPFDHSEATFLQLTQCPRLELLDLHASAFATEEIAKKYEDGFCSKIPNVIELRAHANISDGLVKMYVIVNVCSR